MMIVQMIFLYIWSHQMENSSTTTNSPTPQAADQNSKQTVLKDICAKWSRFF